MYVVTEAQKNAFRDHGYVHLPSVLTAPEVAQLAVVYDRFLSQEIPISGKDLCDMSGSHGRAVNDFSIFNVMLPRKYLPELKGNFWEERAADIARQLHGDGMALDYDQLLSKKPQSADSIFAYHQGLFLLHSDLRKLLLGACFHTLDFS